MAAGADTLQQRVQTQVAAQTAVTHPDFQFFGFKQAFYFPKYQKFLFDQVNTIMGKNKTTISFAALMQQPYFKREFAALSDAQREILADVATQDQDPNVVSEPELLAMLVLLDANLEMNPAQRKEQFKMDTHPSLGETGGLAKAYPQERKFLVESAKKHTRAAEKERAEQKAALEAQRARERAEANAREEEEVRAALQDVQVFEEDGTLNASMAAKAMGLLRELAGEDQKTALEACGKMVFKEQLKTIHRTGPRSSDIMAELKDGTKLETLWNLLVTVDIVYPDGTKERFTDEGKPLNK